MPPHIRPQETVDSALSASDAGMTDADNARLHCVAIKTIRRWRRRYQRQGLPRGQRHTSAPCPRCDKASLDGAAYSELLGWYLGDGHLARARRGVYTLNVFNDDQYPSANAHISELMRRVKPGGRPHTRRQPGCIITTVGWKHWPCVFPQHGPGRKHTRPIVLETWQEEIVREHPFDLLRGLLHSDGCRVDNWATRVVAGAKKRYDYPRWQFVNRSEDILGLFCATLDMVGLPWRRSARYTVSVSRRAAVAVLDERIGLKR